MVLLYRSAHCLHGCLNVLFLVVFSEVRCGRLSPKRVGAEKCLPFLLSGGSSCFDVQVIRLCTLDENILHCYCCLATAIVEFVFCTDVHKYFCQVPALAVHN